MKKFMKKLLTAALSIALTFVSVNTFSGTTVWAATVFQTDVTTPSNGNIFVTVNGTFSTEKEKAIVDKINKIRYEACKEGVKNPATGKKLTLKDYKPVKWSYNLENYARLRASEASVNWAHTRPNSKSTFKNKIAIVKNGYHSAENLAMGYSVLNAIDGYYSEKSIYVQNKKGLTGHYTNIIDPSNTLVGTAGFKQDHGSLYTAMEFGSLFSNKDSNNHKRIGFSGKATQYVEVNVAYLVNSISLSGTKTTYAGSTVKLTAIASMKNATKSATIVKGIAWKTSNSKIATVDKNGNVKALKAGTVTIYASCSGKSASFKITIKNPIKVKSVKLSTSSLKLKVGKTQTLKATVSPTNATNKTVTWSSKNSSIATVDNNGKVTAKKVGTTTIIVTTKDNNKTYSCKVQVTK